MNLIKAMAPVPVNPVRACALQAELQAEYSKQTWRSAYQAALARWQAEGGQVVRVAAVRPSRRVSYTYIE